MVSFTIGVVEAASSSLVTQVHAEFESILKYCLFSQAGVFTPAIIELLKDLNLLFAHRFLEIVVMPSHVLHQLFHLRRIVSAVGLGANIPPPQFCYHITQKTDLLASQHYHRIWYKSSKQIDNKTFDEFTFFYCQKLETVV